MEEALFAIHLLSSMYFVPRFYILMISAEISYSILLRVMIVFSLVETLSISGRSEATWELQQAAYIAGTF